MPAPKIRQGSGGDEVDGTLPFDQELGEARQPIQCFT
jgi:hypothetical protein